MFVRLDGTGLHGGARASVALRAAPGPTSLAVGEAEGRPLRLWRVERADLGVRVACGDETIDLVEHVLSAVGGLGLHQGVEVRVTGGEVPLLDGGAAEVTRALASFGVSPVVPPLVVTRPFSLALGDAAYAIEPASLADPDRRSVSVTIDFAHPRIGRQEARWDGDRADFLERIAPARTFGFLRDHAALLAAGRARGVDERTLHAVVVFGERDVEPPCVLRGEDEPARHKLLDLVGDLALYGGPPRGHVRAERPGHRATHAFVAAALAEGALVSRWGGA